MGVYILNKRIAYNCPGCKAQMYVNRTVLKGEVVERKIGRIHIAYCRCSNCEITCALTVTAGVYGYMFPERDPYDYT